MSDETVQLHRRPHTTDLTATPLGRAIAHRGYSVTKVAEGTGIDRWTLMDYLNERPPRAEHDKFREGRGAGTGSHANRSKQITSRHLARLSMFLKVRAADLQHR